MNNSSKLDRSKVGKALEDVLFLGIFMLGLCNVVMFFKLSSLLPLTINSSFENTNFDRLKLPYVLGKILYLSTGVILLFLNLVLRWLKLPAFLKSRKDIFLRLTRRTFDDSGMSAFEKIIRAERSLRKKITSSMYSGRFNSYADHAEKIESVREISEEEEYED